MGLRLGPERQLEGVVALLTNPGIPTSLRLMGARLPYQASPDARIRFEMRCPGAHAVHLAATLHSLHVPGRCLSARHFSWNAPLENMCPWSLET